MHTEWTVEGAWKDGTRWDVACVALKVTADIGQLWLDIQLRNFRNETPAYFRAVGPEDGPEPSMFNFRPAALPAPQSEMCCGGTCVRAVCEYHRGG